LTLVDDGVAVNVLICGAGTVVTFTVVDAFMVCDPFVADSVYVVVCTGVTLFEEFNPTPMPSSVALVAPVVDQTNVTGCPAATAFGTARIDACSGSRTGDGPTNETLSK
jgi:hypothetical protein